MDEVRKNKRDISSEWLRVLVESALDGVVIIRRITRLSFRIKP